MSEERSVVITRVYDAPPAVVWRAWTEPELLARWWGKRGWNTPPSSVTLDVRPGGAFRLDSISEHDGANMPVDAVFREVVEHERLVFGPRAGGDPATVTFRDLGGGRTEMTLRTTLRGTAELLRRALAGMQSAFDRLAELLTATKNERSKGP